MSGRCMNYRGKHPDKCPCGLAQQEHPRVLDETGHLINTFGCPHDGAPCPSCQEGRPRIPMFFLEPEIEPKEQ